MKYIVSTVLACCCWSLVTPTSRPAELEVQGVHVVPHVQSTELKYRRAADFSLGARVELFVRNASTETLVLPAPTEIRLRGKTPDELLQADAWAWHDFPAACGEPANGRIIAFRTAPRGSGRSRRSRRIRSRTQSD